MSKISFLSQKLFSSASVSPVSQCQPRQSVSALSAKRVFCQPFPVLQMLFDFYSFYDLCVLDLKHFFSIRVKNVIQILKMFKTTFNDVLIEQNDEDSKDLIFETFFKKIDKLIISLIDF
jgi:hypothetical protein